MNIYMLIHNDYNLHGDMNAMFGFFKLTVLTHFFVYAIIIFALIHAEVMELADVPDSKSGDSDIVWVRVPPSAPTKNVLASVRAFFVMHRGREPVRARSV